MGRIGVLVVLAGLAGCAAPAERLPVQPLPQNGQPVRFGEALTRARAQAATATEAFYIDNWASLEEGARALQVTARLLPESTDIPPTQTRGLSERAASLGQSADQLRMAAQAKDVRQANELLQRIHLQVRSLQVPH